MSVSAQLRSYPSLNPTLTVDHCWIRGGISAQLLRYWNWSILISTLNSPWVVTFKVIICIIEQLASCTLSTISFSYPRINLFFFNFSKIKADNLYTKIVQQKYRSPCLFKSKRTSYLFTSSIDWKTIPSSQNARALIRLITRFLCAVQDAQYRMRSTGCAVQDAQCRKRSAVPRNYLKEHVQHFEMDCFLFHLFSFFFFHTARLQETKVHWFCRHQRGLHFWSVLCGTWLHLQGFPSWCSFCRAWRDFCVDWGQNRNQNQLQFSIFSEKGFSARFTRSLQCRLQACGQGNGYWRHKRARCRFTDRRLHKVCKYLPMGNRG